MKDLLFKDDKMVKNTMEKRDNWRDAEKLQHILSHTLKSNALTFFGYKRSRLVFDIGVYYFCHNCYNCYKKPNNSRPRDYFSSLTCRDPFDGPLLFCSGGDIVSVHGKVHLLVWSTLLVARCLDRRGGVSPVLQICIPCGRLTHTHNINTHHIYCCRSVLYTNKLAAVSHSWNLVWGAVGR